MAIHALVFSLIVAAAAASAPSVLDPEFASVALEQDGECSSGDSGCALHALQLRGQRVSETKAWPARLSGALREALSRAGKSATAHSNAVKSVAALDDCMAKSDAAFSACGLDRMSPADIVGSDNWCVPGACREAARSALKGCGPDDDIDLGFLSMHSMFEMLLAFCTGCPKAMVGSYNACGFEIESDVACQETCKASICDIFRACPENTTVSLGPLEIPTTEMREEMQEMMRAGLCAC